MVYVLTSALLLLRVSCLPKVPSQLSFSTEGLFQTVNSYSSMTASGLLVHRAGETQSIEKKHHHVHRMRVRQCSINFNAGKKFEKIKTKQQRSSEMEYSPLEI